MKQKRSHIGCLFWVALILLLIVVFLFNRPKIDQVLKSTGFNHLITKQPPQPKGPPTVKRNPAPPVETQPEITVKPSSPTNSSKPAAPQPTQPAPPSSVKPTSQKTKQTPPSSGGGQHAPKVIARDFQVYFVRVGANGRPVLAAAKQRIDFVDSPLTKTFDTLLSGVSKKEASEGMRSLIPAGTKLLSASVRNGTAYLDFNDRFRFNSYGVEGYNAQLKQVVYTATQFQTVQRVQILLDGKVRKFLAPEGIAIDKPLDRSSFPS